MKKIGFFILDHAGTLFLVSIFLAFVYYRYYSIAIEPNEIKQDVTLMDRRQQESLYYNWEATSRILNDGSESKEKNPYNLSEPCYVLETTLGDEFDYDYGTEAVILAKKCERYAEYEKNQAKLIADREAKELAEEKREQAEEDGLDRLNAKPCN